MPDKADNFDAVFKRQQARVRQEMKENLEAGPNVALVHDALDEELRSRRISKSGSKYFWPSFEVLALKLRKTISSDRELSGAVAALSREPAEEGLSQISKAMALSLLPRNSPVWRFLMGGTLTKPEKRE